jgi:hypothetical protein
MHQH